MILKAVKFFKKISTHLLTVLTIRVILHIEQKRSDPQEFRYIVFIAGCAGGP